MATYTSNEITEANKLKLSLINENKMCFEAFILRIKDEISISCSMPIKLPTKNLLSIIDRSKEWFYKNYEYSVEEGYLYIDKALFETDQFLTDRSIVLPKDIYSVYGLHKVNYQNFDMGKDFVRYSNTYVNYGVEHSFEDLMSYVAAEKYSSMRQQVLSKKYTGFSFNNLSHKFRIAGETPDTGIVLEVYKVIPDCNLFQDEVFFRYVVAQAQKNIALVLGIFAYNLPGNITINYDLISSMGTEAIDKIETEIKEQEGTDYFFMA